MVVLAPLGFSNATDPTTFGYLQKCFPGGPEYDFETRVPRLFEQQLKGYVPDYVQVGGGAWDFLVSFRKRQSMTWSLKLTRAA